VTAKHALHGATLADDAVMAPEPLCCNLRCSFMNKHCFTPLNALGDLRLDPVGQDMIGRDSQVLPMLHARNNCSEASFRYCWHGMLTTA
jgi:hypothetical protein